MRSQPPMKSKLKQLGPGVLVSAAFIGPGTVTTSTLAGANYGFTLLWALVFATLATIVLQEMSARLGTVSRTGLGQALLTSLQNSVFKWPLLLLLLIALYGGNAAYEGGNLAGAALGVSAVFGDTLAVRITSLVLLSSVAAWVLLRGQYRDIERILVGLVMLMALAFVLTFIVVRPDLLAMARGLFSPSDIRGEQLLTVIALIGTTVVPYNLFLHASAAKSRWQHPRDLAAARSDTIISIGLGGLIAILILSTAAASIFANGLKVENAADMARQFEPLFGTSSRYLLGTGLFAAGLSSAITAPLATGFALSEVFNIKGGEKALAFKLIALSVLLIGTAVALSGIKPISLIVTAQFANGLILPIIACFLLYAANQPSIMGEHTNGAISNVLGTVVVLLATALGIKSILAASGFL